MRCDTTIYLVEVVWYGVAGVTVRRLHRQGSLGADCDVGCFHSFMNHATMLGSSPLSHSLKLHLNDLTELKLKGWNLEELGILLVFLVFISCIARSLVLLVIL